jgi:hypothetical protein
MFVRLRPEPENGVGSRSDALAPLQSPTRSPARASPLYRARQEQDPALANRALHARPRESHRFGLRGAQLDRDFVVEARLTRLAKNEALFREVNERISKISQELAPGAVNPELDGLICECSDPLCLERLDLLRSRSTRRSAQIRDGSSSRLVTRRLTSNVSSIGSPATGSSRKMKARRLTWRENETREAKRLRRAVQSDQAEGAPAHARSPCRGLRLAPAARPAFLVEARAVTQARDDTPPPS